MAAPFTAAGTLTGAALIEQTYKLPFEEGIFKNTEVIPRFGPMVDSGGGTSYGIIFHTAGNATVTLFDEGDSDPDPDSQEWVKATVDYNHYIGKTQITGHARAAMRSAYLQGIEAEFSMLREDMMDLVNTTTLSAANSGIQVAVDSSTTYGSISSRSSATYAVSKETAVNAVVGYEDMIDILEALKDNDFAANPNQIWVPYNQLTRIYAIGGQPALKNISDADAAPNYFNVTFAGIPVVPTRDLTDTVILFLDTTKWVNVLHEGFRVEEQRSGDSKTYAVTMRFLSVCRDPRRQGKLTGCTA